MGTNYYLYIRSNHCEHCGRVDEEKLHIGKSSAGWVFALKLYPDRGIDSLDDWRKKLHEGIIRDNYGNMITLEAMIQCITDRRWNKIIKEIPKGAVQGPRGLLMADPSIWSGGHKGYGENNGTWEYIAGGWE